MQFLVSNYFATGEGNSVCLLVTKAYPRKEDYLEDGELANSAEFRAAREFIEQFGGFYAMGVENLPKEEFFKKYKQYLPSFLERLVEEGAGNINYSMKFHLNFS